MKLERVGGNIKRQINPKVVGWNLRYVYEFQTPQYLENIDDYSRFGIDHDSMKQDVVDALVDEFRMELNRVVFGRYETSINK